MSDKLAALEIELSKWCQSYVGAFNAYDAEEIGRHWMFPALIISAGRSWVFQDAENFTRNTNTLLAFYEREGVARAERKLVSCMEMSEDVVAMVIADRMYTATDALIVQWRASYVMQKMHTGWFAVCAAADGEVEAWRARGTPLGS